MKLFWVILIGIGFTATLKGQEIEERAITLQNLVDSNNAFAWKLYSQFDEEDGNLIFSPYSISTAFAMVYAGSEGRTAQEIKKVFQFPSAQKQVAEVYNELQSHLSALGMANDNLQLMPANSLWMQTGFPIIPEFLKTITNQFKGALRRVDFVGQQEIARGEINRWVREKTQGKIVDILQPHTISSSTRLVLISALYLKGRWQTPFDSKLTRQAPFFPSQERSVTVPMMENTATYRYGRQKEFAIIELPYTSVKGMELSFFVLLPHAKNGLEDLEKTWTPSQWKDWLLDMKMEQVKLTLPKFKITWETSLKDTLQQMGLRAPFSDEADFSRIVQGKALQIGQALHKAFIAVDESGTEAAAATSVSINLTSMQGPPILFKADHPFLFIIAEQETGAILFIGRLRR